LFFEIPNLDKVAARKIETHIKAMKSKKYINNLKKYPEISLKLIAKYSSSDK
jgi:putative endonuclease